MQWVLCQGEGTAATSFFFIEVSLFTPFMGFNSHFRIFLGRGPSSFFLSSSCCYAPMSGQHLCEVLSLLLNSLPAWSPPAKLWMDRECGSVPQHLSGLYGTVFSLHLAFFLGQAPWSGPLPNSCSCLLPRVASSQGPRCWREVCTSRGMWWMQLRRWGVHEGHSSYHQGQHHAHGYFQLLLSYHLVRVFLHCNFQYFYVMDIYWSTNVVKEIKDKNDLLISVSGNVIRIYQCSNNIP